MSWTFTMNSEGGSKGLLVCLSTAWAVKVYCACSSRSRVFVAWMFPVLSSMTKMVPAPSPERIYLILPLPVSTSECSWKRAIKSEILADLHFAVCVSYSPVPPAPDQARCTPQWRKTDSRPSLVWTCGEPALPSPPSACVCARTGDLQAQKEATLSVLVDSTSRPSLFCRSKSGCESGTSSVEGTTFELPVASSSQAEINVGGWCERHSTVADRGLDQFHGNVSIKWEHQWIWWKI